MIYFIFFLWFQTEEEHLQVSIDLISRIDKLVNSWKPEDKNYKILVGGTNNKILVLSSIFFHFQERFSQPK